MTNEWTWGDQEVKTPMSNKSEALKNAHEGLFPGTAQAIRECKCPACHNPIVIADFVDLLSVREYEISGLCQVCQDEFFNSTGEE